MSGGAARVADDDARAVVWRLRQIAVSVALMALAFVQSPGLVAPDTKLDLTQAPVAFLGRALTMWDPIGFAGQLQNQAYGYLFPIGPFFALGDAAGFPGWVVQRLWWGTVLIVAFTGVVALARRLEIGSPGTQLLAGVAFALSPRMISTLGPVSAEAWPMALAPWVVVPLVAAANGGGWRRPAMASALVVALMGGVNAALCLASVVPAVVYLATRTPGARSLRLGAWWAGSVVVATLWWVVPLLLLGRFSPPFLDYIETGDVTTSKTSLIQGLRGTSHWVAYLGPELGSGWLAGHDLVTRPALILDTVLVAAVGLTGLCLAGLRERGWLVVMLIAGTLAVTFGHVGVATPWFAGSERDLLDGVLAPLRNLHKFDGVIRLPLVLGLAHAAAVLPSRLRSLSGGRFAASALTGLIVVGVAGVAAPAVAGRIAPAGSFTDVPGYWHEASDWLDGHPGGRTLLLPGSRFATYGWGSTMDEPIQALGDTPWDVRNAIPLVPPGHIRALDAVERILDSGEPSPVLAAYLARAGIGRVLVRNDLDQDTSGSVRPILVHQVLDESPGFTRVASFGPEIGQPASPGLFVDDGLRAPLYAAVEVYELDQPGDLVDIRPATDLVQVTGGPESLVQLLDAGLLGDAPTVLTAQDGGIWTASEAVLTDGLRRREVDFGGAIGNGSRVLTADESLRLDRPESDYLVSDDPADLTVAGWRGVASIVASSSRADAGTLGGAHPESAPAAAFDGSAETSWLAADPGDRSWLDVHLEAPLEIGSLSVELPRAISADADVAEVRVEAAGERFDVPVDPGARVVDVALAGAAVQDLRVELFRRPGSVGPLGIAELTIPGIAPRQVLIPPPLEVASPDQSAAVSLAVAPGHRDACVVSGEVYCAASLSRVGEEDEGLHRRIELATAVTLALSAEAAPRAGHALDRVIDAAARPGVVARASSSVVDDPLGGPLAAVDGDPATGWVAGPFDPDPALTLRWREPVSFDGLALSWSDSLAASRPTQVLVDTGRDTYRRTISAGGEVDLPSMRTRAVTIRFAALLAAYSYDTTFDTSQRLPVGVSDIVVPGAPGGAELLGSSAAVFLDCGQGPVVDVDGVAHATSVETTVGALARLSPVSLEMCGPADVDLAAGTHDVDLEATPLWRPEAVTLRAPGWEVPAPAVAAVDVGTWSETRRTVELPDRDQPQLLTVRENANPGWVATLDGEELPALEVDGWMQGYLVPAGAAGTVSIDYRPDTTYRLALWAGLALLVGLGAAALVRSGRSGSPAAQPLRLHRAWVVALALGAGLLLGGVAGLVCTLVAAALRLGVGRLPPRDGDTAIAWGVVPGALACVAGAVLAASGDTVAETADGVVQIACLAALAFVMLAPSPHGEARRRGVDQQLQQPGRHDAAGRREREDVAH